MDIGVPLKELGKVNADALIEKVKSLPANVWEENDLRQKSFDVHRQTQSIVMLFCDGWPNLEVKKHTGWELLGSDVMPVMQEIIGRHYPSGGHMIRIMVANLKSGGQIDEHFDSGPSFQIAHRIHVPLQTDKDVEFMLDGQRVYLDVGHAYEINNIKFHSVHNKSDEDRYHLIFDYLPPKKR